MEKTLTLSTDLLRGHVDTIILKLLTDGDKYGYEICKIIAETTHGQFELKEATLYSCLRRLEQEQKVKSYWGDETSGGRRKYYAITEIGKNAYTINNQQWQLARKILDQLM